MSQRELDHVLSFIGRMVDPPERPTQPPERLLSVAERDYARDDIVDRITRGDREAWFGRFALLEPDDEGRILEALQFAIAMPSASAADRWAYVERRVRDIADAIAEEEVQ